MTEVRKMTINLTQVRLECGHETSLRHYGDARLLLGTYALCRYCTDRAPLGFVGAVHGSPSRQLQSRRVVEVPWPTTPLGDFLGEDSDFA